MAATFGAGSDGPLLMQQQPPDPSRSMLAQVLANAQNAPPPRTGNAAMMQGLAQILAGGGNAFMAGQDRRDQEEAGDIISGLITGKAPEPKPSFVQRAANFVGLGGDKPAATPAPEPRSRQFAQLIAEGGQPDQTPSVGMPPVVSPDSGAPMPSPVAAPTAGPTGTPLSSKEQLARALASSNPRVKAWAMNRALAIQDAETKRDAELDKEYATKGLRRNPDGSVSRVTGYGTGVGENEADKFSAQTPTHLARRQGEADQDFINKPKLKFAESAAETPALVDRATQMIPVNARQAGANTTATEAAALPFVEPKATAQARGTGTGSAQAALAPAPAAPGVTPGGTVAQALKEAEGKGVQIAQGPEKAQQKEQSLRQEYDQIPAVKTYRETVKDFSAIQDASTRDTKASDLNMVYGLAHIMDPNSVVREGEQIAVKNTQGLPDWIVGRINEINGGAGLTPAGRADIVREARSRLDATKGVHDQFEGVYKRLAQENGLKHENVVVPIVAPPAPAAQPRPGAPGPVTVPAATPQPGLVVPPQRGAQAAPDGTPLPQFTPEQIQAEIARRRLKAQ